MRQVVAYDKQCC
uniref:Uncharacterized protein n=1 Tax=Lepeophtheirus salmonis TaxID=72036 RepID=A0A0K2TWL6_LEPSM